MADSYHVQLGRFLRKKRGDTTYVVFAKKLGVSFGTLHRMEQGTQNVTLKTLERITSRLKCSVRDIFE